MRLFWPAVLVLATSCGVADSGLPVVTGAFGAEPAVAIPDGAPGRLPRVAVLSAGQGRRTAPGDVVLADVSVRLWSDGSRQAGTYEARQPVSVVFDGRTVPRAWHEALMDRPAGSRVVLVSPAAEAAGPGVPLDGVDPEAVVVVVFDVLGGYPPDARRVGRPLPTVPAGLPLDRASTLIDGSGPEIREGARLVVQYLAMRVPGRRIVDSSFRRGGPSAVTLAPGSAPAAWLAGLVGGHVGARMAVPEPGPGGPDGGRTVYVIDIIDALQPL
ncbi:hypothetical protein ACIBG4_09375 [Nonomuraea sp. NPDC050383]|uniref:hypothetical protein n=1 Tax=Nonomuraea sp. NPDC050383 TaxID=3364362 RepID=UPI00379BA6FB